MANPQNEAEKRQPMSTNSENEAEKQQPVATGLMGKIQDRFQKSKENAEAYPYVWASYILVYGGLGTWFAFRWRKLRQTEDRIRALQKRLQEHYLREQAHNSTSASSFIESSSQLAKKPPK